MIEHLSHRPRLPLAGKIRLGIKVKNAAGVEYPKDLDHFVMPPELVERDPEHFDAPKSLDVMFHSDEIPDVFDSWYELYSGRAGGAGGLLSLRCDGRNYEKIPKNVKEEVERGPCRRPLPEAGKPWPACECGSQPKGRLMVLLIHAPVGVYRLVMGGHQQIQQLYEDIRMRAAEFGRLRGIPFKLLRRPETTSVPDRDGNRIPKTGHPVRLDSTFTLYQALTSRGVDPYQIAEKVQRALPQPIDDEPDLDDVDDDDEPRADGAEIERRDEGVGVREPHVDGVAERRESETVFRTDASLKAEDDEGSCYLLAYALDISQDDYALYTTKKYGLPPGGHLGSEQVAQECAMFRAAILDEDKEELYRRITTKIAALRAAKKDNG